MIKITDAQKKYLIEQFVDINSALEKDDLGELLLVIDDAIVDNIVDHNDEPDEIGIQLQRIYDQIYNQNAEDQFIWKLTSAAHTIDRVCERGVLHTDVLNAMTSPLHIGEIKTDQYGRRSQRFIGSNATVNINPDTGNVVTVWPTGKDTRKKYQGGD